VPGKLTSVHDHFHKNHKARSNAESQPILFQTASMLKDAVEQLAGHKWCLDTSCPR